MKTYICALVIAVTSIVSCGQSDEDSSNSSNDKKKVETPTGDVQVSDAYEADKMPDGNYTNYYTNKQLKVSGMVDAGVRVGQWVSYHANGNKQSENEYKVGVLHGKTVTYYENGQIMYIGYYKGGNYEGDWLYYNKDGIHLKTIVYKGGKVITSKIVNDTIV